MRGLAGARSFVAVAAWAADLDPAMRAEVGLVGPVPSESTFRRVLQKLDADRFDALLGAWAERRTRPQGGLRRHLAVDGKTVRGSSGSDGPARHLLAALDPDHGVVLAQVGVAATTGEAAQVPVLLAGLNLTDVVITADAAPTQQATAGALHARGAPYVLTVKRHQPKLFAQLTALPWRHVPGGHHTRDHAHGRVATRTVKAVAVRAGLGFPDAAQAVQVTRCRCDCTGRRCTETAYAATLGEAIRGHQTVDNRLHWVRDVTFDADHSQVRTGNRPRVIASLRNLALTVLRLTSVTNIAAALHHHARHRHRPLNTVTTC